MIGYITGLRALIAAQVGLNTAGNNTANAATPGYSRQRALMVSTASVQFGPRLRIGTGVEATTVDRITDTLLESRIRTQERALGRFDMLSLSYSELESSFQEPSQAGLSARISTFFSSITSLTTSPQDTQRRAAMVNDAGAMSERFHLLSSQIEEFESNVVDQVGSKLLDINRLADNVARLNQQIIEQTAAGGSANEIKDERSRLLKDLNRIVDAKVLEQDDGSATVQISGQILVSRSRARELDFTRTDFSEFRIQFKDSGQEIEIRDGELRGLLEISTDVLPEVRSNLDDLARNLIFEFNRIHSTGVPRNGSFSSLSSSYPVTNSIGNAPFVPLSEAGLPFDVQAGDLRFTVTDEDTGEVTQTTISIDPDTDSLTNIADTITSIDHLDASVDGQGLLVIRAETGHSFDFSPRLDPNPDDVGSFAGSRATISGSAGGPFSLTNGDQIDLAVDGGPAQTVTFNTADFGDISAATADEIISVIEAQTTGVSASVVGGRVVLQSDTDGSTGSIQASNATGDPIGTIGLPTTADTGTDSGVNVSASGTYTGDTNQQFRFVASANGEIGVTEGLTIDVYDESGTVIRTLNVGDGYVPGDSLAVVDGIEISFGEGEISADSGDTFVVDAVADSDTADLLPAVGLNSFFSGTDAADIDVDARIRRDSGLIAGGLSGAPGDNQNFLRFLDLQDEELATFGGETLEGFYAGLVADVGSDGLKSLSFFESQSVLTDFLEAQRDSVSGVSLEEETVNLLRFQRQFEAASRYIAVVDATMVEVLSLIG